MSPCISINGELDEVRTVYLFLGVSAASLAAMVLVDCFMGARAEFLNAFSVVQRLAGLPPPAGESLVAQKFGATGELGIVVAANLVVGGIVTRVIRFLVR